MSQTQAVKTVFHERFGEVTRGQLAAYRKHNISQCDHWDLTEVFGEDNHRAIEAAVRDPANNMEDGNCFSAFQFQRNLRG